MLKQKILSMAIILWGSSFLKIMTVACVTFHGPKVFGVFFQEPAKWRVTVSGELGFMRSYLES